MTKRKISKASKRRLSFFAPICIVFVIYFVFSAIYNFYTIYSLTKEKEKLEKKYYLLQEESEKLKTDIEKFNDEKYLADYARENYKYSKDGEYVLQLDEEEKTKEEMNLVDIELDRKYIFVLLSFIFLIIIICIFSKNKTSKKKKKKK